MRASYQQLIASEQEIKKHSHELGERVKELGCFYGISETVRKRETIEEILQDITQIIPPSWQYPEITCAKISFGNIEYKTDNYDDSNWKMSSDIIVKQKIAGKIEVWYLEQKSQNDVDPFLKEEKTLLDNITERLGRIIERKNAEEELKTTNQQLEASNQQLKASNQQLTSSEQQLKAANQQLNANNQQLSATEQQLRASNQQLTASEKDLKKEKEFSENLLMTANAFILTLDTNANITLFNKFAEKLTGYTNDEVIGKNWFDLFIPKGKGFAILEVFANVLKEMPEFSSYENPVLCKTGTEKFISWENTIIKNENGEISGVLSIGTDITERKLAEKENIKLSTAVTQSPSVIVITDLKGNLEYVNPKFTELTGYTSKEVIGVNPRILKSGELADEMYKELWKTISSGKEWRGDLHNITKSGELFWEAALISPIFDKQGKIINYIKVAKDITERKLAENQIKKDLKIKTVLIQEIYHRTKNNMAVISAMISIQSRRSENEYVKSTFNEINNKIQAMSLVHQKLYKAKDLSNISLKDYIEDLANLIMRSYGVLSTKIKLKFDLQDVKISIDSAVPLGLIINELVSNVFKHAFPNRQEGEIFIRLFKEKDKTISLELFDNGIGFPQNFDPRKDGSMGFASVFSIVESQLKGEISVKSENGLRWHIKIKDDKKKERV